LLEWVDLLPDVLSASLLRLPVDGAVKAAATRLWHEEVRSRTRTVTDLPPVLLTVANYNGTLAAVRTLGRAGIRVATADRSSLAVSSWSRYASTRVQCPEVRDSDRFVEWLTDFGRRHGRHVLLPTSDDTAWLYALHRAELSRHFYLTSPTVDVIYRLLNKAYLYREAVQAGLDVPRTWFPDGVDDLDRCRQEATFPVIVKPRTQVLFRTQSKGAYVEHPEQLTGCYAAIAGQPHEAGLLKRDPSAAQPMVQEFYREAASGIYNISGYVRQGQICGLRAARKLFQQPRRLGIGLCFEEAPVAPELAAGLARLVGRLQFSGVFEAEFIQTKDRSLLIDFNPRFYNQMAFDIARGLPLPLLAYYDALGDDQQFDDLCGAMANPSPPHGRVFVDLISLRVLLTAQRLSGALSRAEKNYWTHWHEANKSRCTYAVIDSADRLPAWLHGMQLLLRSIRHPRNFVRSIVLNRS
jgi:D-aspartate ligase